MASFVIHNIAMEQLIKNLKENYGVNFRDTEEKELIFANLIVDSSKLKYVPVDGLLEKENKKRFREMVQAEKVATHFRRVEELNFCIQVPDMEMFINKYNDLLNSGNLSVFGYLFHLYTDKMFFDNLFTATFETLDENLNPTIYTKDTKKMLVKKNNKLYDVALFWDGSSDKSIYYDYTVMNKILLEYFSCNFDKEKLLGDVDEFRNPGIEEVNFENIKEVLNKTEGFIKESYQCNGNDLNIFDKDMVIKFINDVVSNFINDYGYIVLIGNKKMKERKR